ncbi:MAG: hypothetical protein IK115_04720 [Lachnospiraceae bacterium]|nr:hypothetical protein [Lachnospiraceae bacterium]
MEKRRLCFLSSTVIIALFFASCGNKDNPETTGSDTMTVTEAEMKETEDNTEKTQEVVIEEPEEGVSNHKAGYEFCFEKKDADKYVPVVFYNIPSEYSIERINQDVITGEVKFDLVYDELNEYNEAGVDAFFNVDLLSTMPDVSFTDSFETEYGKADIYTYEDYQYAVLSVDGDLVRFGLKKRVEEEGAIQRFLTEAFAPSDNIKELVLPEIEDKHVSVNANEYDYVFGWGGAFGQGEGYVFGMNYSGEVVEGNSTYNSEDQQSFFDLMILDMEMPDGSTVDLKIRADDYLDWYKKQFFIMDGRYGWRHKERIEEVKEVDSVEMKAGTVKIYYVKIRNLVPFYLERDLEYVEEEIGVLHNNDDYIFFEASRSPFGDKYDGEYDGILKEVLKRIE